MSNKKISELTQVQTLPDGTSVFTAVDTSRASGDQNVKISKEDLIALVGSSPIATNPVENEYTDIAAMLADQANQTERFFQYVIDASDDPTVTSGEAYYEKLSTTTGNLSDYRKLSDEEIIVVESTRGFKVFRVQSISDSQDTSVNGGRVRIVYNNATDKVSGFLFNSRYSDIITNIVSLDSDFDYVINVYNQQKRKYHLAKVTSFSTVNTDYIYASVDDKIDRLQFDVDDRIEVNFDVDVEGDSNPPKQEDINGTRLVNASATGAINLDLNAYVKWNLTLTGATTLTFTNLPTGDNVKVVELMIDGAQTLTFADTIVFDPDSDTYDGLKYNRYTFTIESDIIRAFLKNLGDV